MKVVDINASNALKDYIEKLKVSIKNAFDKVDDSGEVIVINNFPAVTDQLGKISLLFFINIPYKTGSYYSFNRGCYLNSLVFGINFVSDKNIIDVDDNNYITDIGSLSYKEELDKQGEKFTNWVYNLIRESDLVSNYFKCVFFDWVRADNLQIPPFENEYVIVNKNLSIKNIVNAACRRIYVEDKNSKFKGCSSFTLKRETQLSDFTKLLIDKANEETTLGILTKKKVDMITRPTQITKKISELQGEKLCLITGKAGSGKTLALMRALYEIISQKKHARFLTYNNLLAMDIKQYLRNIDKINSKNATFRTLHKFFYDLSKRMRIQALLTRDRVKELLEICTTRVEIGESIIENYLRSHESFPVISSEKDPELNNILDELFKYSEVDVSDKFEVEKYLIESLKCFLPNRDKRASTYIQKKKELLENEIGTNYFISDYNKVLEVLYLMIDDTPEFYRKFDIGNKYDFIPVSEQDKILKKFKVKDRHELLAKIKKTDIVLDDEEKVTLDELNIFIKSITPTITWSNSIIIDEGQDCNIYEKLIIMKLRGPENLIVASGGKDQLIRKATEIDWHVAVGTPVLCEDIPLGRKTHRLKGNIVKFVNEFNHFYSLTTPLQTLDELEGTGNVIIDFRSGIPFDIIEEQRIKGKVLGCSPYESIMFLVPGIGFTDKTKHQQLTIDSDDNISLTEVSTNRKLILPEIPNIAIWNGTSESKGKLDLPNQTQTRCIYYDSCRGLEAWSIFSLNVDVFYNLRKDSEEAEKYAIEQNNLFTEKEILKRNYALLWCNMVFTRAIDTLYINVKDKTSEFSKNLFEIAKRCGSAVRIINNEEMNDQQSF